MAIANGNWTFEETLLSGDVYRTRRTTGVSADNSVEFIDTSWEAVDAFGRKVSRSEQSIRNASGILSREASRESIYLVNGTPHIEKTTEKLVKNQQGDELLEKWSERTAGAARVEMWAGKWTTIHQSTQLEAGHPRVLHESVGEKYDGQGGCEKFAIKWAESLEGRKYCERWDEHIDPNGHSVKKGETWWEDQYGVPWGQTLGGPSGSGWVTHV